MRPIGQKGKAVPTDREFMFFPELDKFQRKLETEVNPSDVTLTQVIKNADEIYRTFENMMVAIEGEVKRHIIGKDIHEVTARDLKELSADFIPNLSMQEFYKRKWENSGNSHKEVYDKIMAELDALKSP